MQKTAARSNKGGCTFTTETSKDVQSLDFQEVRFTTGSSAVFPTSSLRKLDLWASLLALFRFEHFNSIVYLESPVSLIWAK